MRRGIAAAVLATAIAVSASACGSSGGSSSGGSAANAGPVTITWWDTSDATNEAPTYKALVAQFEQANPNIKVNYVNVPFANAQAKFTTAATAGKGAPDVLRSDVGWVAGFAQAGLLAPLDGTPAAAEKSSFEPQLIQQATYQGKLFGMPEVTDTLALMYNKSLFAKAGITAAPKTWDELKADSALVKQKAGVDGFAFNPASYYAMPFLYGEGTDMVDLANKKLEFNSAAAIKGINTLKDLVSAPGVSKLDTTPNGYANIMDAFETGKVASIIQGPWETTNVFKGAAFSDKTNLGIAVVPAGSAGKAGAPIGGHNLVAYAGSDAAHQAASEKFIAFLTSAQSQIEIATKNSTLPTRTDAYTSAVTANPGIAGFQAVLSAGVPRPALAHYSDLYGPFGTELTKMLTGQESVAQGMSNSTVQAQKLLPDYAAQ
ncbi:extracellular solute-binding protein [Streptacidiphilus jiangxiensis]|uniref:Arabinogalactan oligomer / maltooligosaccharide transport system substrate-binding protein n=1 Tax=Streptacidiphilus jiangxiensis TaxID=235985 RepID=A0A1H7X218_STRJI|nr:extracellular solute-binding protein [Streptacidiphilus jiangxiensis]SEM27624.1 arabinogalactan oligomer / maltooligosaccharide transport system substrate-binding protein [Streptacidiphilus jiangxiensis]